MKHDRRTIEWPHKALFDHIPLDVIVIDRDFTIVEANKQAQETYPEWRNKRCFELFYGKKKRCEHCAAVKTFEDGKTRMDHSEIKGDDGITRFYKIHVSAYKDEDGNIPYVIEMANDITDRVTIEREFRLLFDNVPCYISVIDRDFKVVDSNDLFKKTFSREGTSYCYEMYKERDKVCTKCPAVKSFKTGKRNTSIQVGVDKSGNKTHYVVTAAPLVANDKTVDRVIEMSLDISEVIQLQEKLKQAEAAAKEAIRLNPEDAEYFSLLASIQFLCAHRPLQEYAA